jgi:predicted permease
MSDPQREVRQRLSPPHSNTEAAITPRPSSGRMLAELWQDLRYAARMVRKRPAFAAVATLTLAVGIGANTAIFSVLYGVLLKPLPFHEPERLVSVWHTAPGFNMPLLEQGAATYFTYRESNQVFEDIGVWDSREVSITGHGEPEHVSALWVTDGVLPILRVQPLRGRFFTKEDDAPGSPRRVILTHGYWQRRFGGAPDAIGRLLNVDGKSAEIIGVLSPSFKFLQADPAVLLPFQFNRAEALVGDFSFQAVARLRAGVTVEQANADLGRMIPLTFDRFGLYPGLTRKMLDEARIGPAVRPLSQDVIGNVGRVLWILAGTVGIVLLIACANVANLFLVRAEGRHQELAVRTALGASRSRLARQLLSESVELSLAGGALGLLFAWAGLQLLTRLAPVGLPRIDEVGIDPVVLGFTLAISILTGLLFGVIPVLRFGTAVVRLKESGRAASDAPGRQRWRNALAVSEIASTLVLLIVSGLMVRTFVALGQVDPGFVRPAEIQTFRVSIPKAFIQDPHQTALAYEQMVRQLEQVPGVASVGLSSSVTMDQNGGNTPIFVDDLPLSGKAMPPLRRYKRIAPGYFRAMGNPLLAGRDVTWSDIHEGRPVVVVSEALARAYWKNPVDALGKRLRQNQQNPWREIVGIVGSERDDGLDKPAAATVYWPLLLKDWWKEPTDVNRTMTFVVRSPRVGSPGFPRELQQAVWSVNANLPLAGVRTLDEIQADSMAQTSFALVMLAIAAAVALLLGSVGLYSVIAYSASQRTREIGIRVALGAQIRDVRGMFLRQGLILAATGITLGIGIALGLTQVMSALLFGVGTKDPVTFIAVSAALAAITLIATYLPARRASRVDPIIAMRADV